MWNTNTNINVSTRDKVKVWEFREEVEKIKEEKTHEKRASSLRISPSQIPSNHVFQMVQQVENSADAQVVNLNVGKNLKGLKDSTIADLIKQRIPKDTYGQINVNTIKNYYFEGETAPVSARKIILTRSNTKVAGVSLKVFVTSLFGKNIQDQGKKYESMLDLALIKDDLIGSLNENEQDKKNAEEEIIKAFARCMTITLTISDDCNFAEIKGNQAGVFIVARKAGQQLRLLYKKEKNT